MFTDLANELLQSLANCLELERDINALARTNRRLYCLLDPPLYRHKIRQSSSSALVWAAIYSRERTDQKAIDAWTNVHVGSDIPGRAWRLRRRMGTKGWLSCCYSRVTSMWTSGIIAVGRRCRRLSGVTMTLSSSYC
ncbi:hypothetical protein B0T10DRAFT_501186 [Thelonectria olida]|uniref:F-box domain-containing protein n=1 Tax=Thelonectria olida TaxID=1576542 RepID=A0A9P8VPW2_9HYPO|nr:hypothetical protein B0T10DRAFT_501186 [Thelonectria olida]